MANYVMYVCILHKMANNFEEELRIGGGSGVERYVWKCILKEM